jgi:hypothetical protein
MVPVRYLGRIAPLIALVMSVSGCRLVHGIFKVGVWAGVIAVLFVAALAAGAAKLFGGHRT